MEARLITIHAHGPCQAIIGPPGGDGPLRLGEARLCYATLERLSVRRDAYAALLDEEERQRAARFRFARDRERYILGHGYLRETLARLTGTDPAALRFERGEFGKPTLVGHELRFNFSDTKDAVLVGATLGQEIGVDVETMDREVSHLNVAHHYFTPEEIGELADDAASKRRFLELWTRKEAVLKASGVGITDDLRALRVNADINTVRFGHGDLQRMAADAYHVSTWRLDEARIASVALERNAEVVIAG
ncbi:MAG: 4'-phosphopantetheinyl transferase family protein [Flavobacteriales bacterium]